MSAADQDNVLEALDDLPRARGLMALLRWAISHRDPPTNEAWGGLYILACDAERAVENVERALRGDVSKPVRGARRGTS